jgi:hypothetical protein
VRRRWGASKQKPTQSLSVGLDIDGNLKAPMTEERVVGGYLFATSKAEPEAKGMWEQTMTSLERYHEKR